MPKQLSERLKQPELGDAADHLLVVSIKLGVVFQRDIDEPDKLITLNVFFYKRKYQWWANFFKIKPQQHHQQLVGREKKLKQLKPMNRQYQFQFQPNFNGNFSSFSRTEHFNQKMSVGKTETGSFIDFLVIRTMFTISKIVNQTQTRNNDNSPKI